ncbi:septal ring lytic transglycosylase RlpA family protein [Halochromatium sp.]
MRNAAILSAFRAAPALLRLTSAAGLLVILVSCGGTPTSVDNDALDLASDPLPKAEPKSRYGNMASYVVLGKRYYTKHSSRNHVERGLASWYGKKFHGRRTSSGERYDMHRMTAAHKSLPLPTYALVTNLENGRSAVVKVNDRGPFVGNRIIDLSYAAAKRLDMVNAGTAHVEVRSIDPRDHGKDAKELLRLASTDVDKQESTGSISFLDSGSSSAKTRKATVLADQAGAIFLQVGAFGSRDNAEQLKSQLTRRVEAPVLVRAAAVTGMSQPLYKVQVGPVRSRSDGDALGRRLVALGIDKPVVVIR